MDNPLRDILDHQRTVILDGGLATTLEGHGYDLDDPLWSARLLLDEPEAIARVHTEFLAAGADVITTATYQASLPGLATRGVSADEAVTLIRSGVELAVRARDTFWADTANRQGRHRPLVAASVGPYGAYLADGSEYDGRYGVDAETLRGFHRGRLEILADGGADLLACETMPSFDEIEVLLGLLAERPRQWAWISFCCRDGERLWDETPVAEAARACARVGNVIAVGINCTAPRFVAALVGEMGAACDLPILAYPNAGETYLPESKTWIAAEDSASPLAAAPDWVAAGVRGVGGCCRVGPAAIAKLRRSLLAP